MEPIRIKVEKKEGGFIAQCLDNPAIIVTGASKADMRKNLNAAITGYVYAFPEDKNEFFQDGKMRRVDLLEARLVPLRAGSGDAGIRATPY